MRAHSTAGRGEAGGAAARVVAPDAIERQVRDEVAQALGGVRLEHRLQPLVVLVHLQVSLGERLTEQIGRLFPVVGAGERRCGFQQIRHFVSLVADVNSINIDLNVNVVNMAVQRSAVRRRQSYHHGDLKRALTSAALSLVAEKGPKGFTLTEAARRAGVSAAAPYRHFADKAELLAAVAEQGFQQLHADLAAAADRASDPKERVVELGRAYVRWAIDHPDHYQVMFGAESLKAEQPSVAVAGEQAFGDLLDAITKCQEAGIVGDRDPREVAAPLWSLVHGIASLAIGGQLGAVGIVQAPDDIIAGVVAQVL